MAETITIPKSEYYRLREKARIADDILYQLDMSLKDAESGRIRKVL